MIPRSSQGDSVGYTVGFAPPSPHKERETTTGGEDRHPPEGLVLADLTRVRTPT